LKYRIVAVFACLFFATGTLICQSFIPRNYYGARLEPAAKVLHGAGQCYWSDSTQQYCKTLKGKYDPAIINDYTSLNGTTRNVDAFIGHMKTWLAKFPNYTSLQLAFPLGESDDKLGKFKDLTQDVADGTYDDYLNYLFAALDNLNIPVFIRIGYECNGSWNLYNPGSYKRAYARVANLLRNSVLGNNAASVWCISGKGNSSYMNWYPGDESVDWWSIDLFPSGSITSDLTKNFLNQANTHRKPVMIGESSASHTGTSQGRASWDQWFKPYFELISNNPGIKAFNYINWDWRNYPKRYPGWVDGRIGSNALIAGLYAREMSSPLYMHASTKQAIMDSLKPPALTTPLPAD
jgi:hypothetical protein